MAVFGIIVLFGPFLSFCVRRDDHILVPVSLHHLAETIANVVSSWSFDKFSSQNSVNKHGTVYVNMFYVFVKL
jgi:hypothetical protein